MNPFSPKKLLCVKLRSLGDTALWTSSLLALKASYPTADLHVLVLEGSAPLLWSHPAVNTIHTLESASPLEIVRKLWSLRKHRFDWVLGFHATESFCRWVPLLGAKENVLHHHSSTKSPRASTRRVPRPGYLENAILRDYQILNALGIQGEPPTPCLYLSQEERNWGHETLGSLKQSGRRLLCLLPGAGVSTRRYPQENWNQLVDFILEERRWVPFVIVDPSLALEWDLERWAHDRGVMLFLDFPIRKVMALISQAEVVVANDSGPAHLAAALGPKTLTLFGPGCVGDWHPYPLPNHRYLQISVDCRDCGPRSLPLFQYCTLSECSHHRCMKGISPTSVVNALNHFVI